MNLYDYKQYFDRLQAIAYKQISINGVCIRVLGVHFMDNGPDWKVIKHRHSFFEFHYVAENYDVRNAVGSAGDEISCFLPISN